MTDKPLTENDFSSCDMYDISKDVIYKKIQSAKRLLKRKIRKLTGFLNIIDEVDACFQIDDNQEAAKGGYVSREGHPEDTTQRACKPARSLGDVSGSPRKSLNLSERRQLTKAINKVMRE